MLKVGLTKRLRSTVPPYLKGLTKPQRIGMSAGERMEWADAALEVPPVGRHMSWHYLADEVSA